MTSTYETKVRFRTAQPLSQRAGMRFWENGFHFVALPGKATYQFSTRGVAESPAAAVEGVCEAVELFVAEDIPRWVDVEFLGLTVDVMTGS